MRRTSLFTALLVSAVLLACGCRGPKMKSAEDRLRDALTNGGRQ